MKNNATCTIYLFISIFNIRLQETCIIDNEISFMSCIISMGHSSFANLPPSYLLSSDYSVVKENLSLSWVLLECQHNALSKFRQKIQLHPLIMGPEEMSHFLRIGSLQWGGFHVISFCFADGSLASKRGVVHMASFFEASQLPSYMSSALHHHIIHAVIFLFLIS